jgi:hypothetical protein
MADGEQRANNCASAEFGYDDGRNAFALVGCAKFSNPRESIPLSTVRVKGYEGPKGEPALCQKAADLLSDTCMRCIEFSAGAPLVHPYRLLKDGADPIGGGTDGEYYGGSLLGLDGTIPTGQVSEAMQQMGA